MSCTSNVSKLKLKLFKKYKYRKSISHHLDIQDKLNTSNQINIKNDQEYVYNYNMC